MIILTSMAQSKIATDIQKGRKKTHMQNYNQAQMEITVITNTTDVQTKRLLEKS